MLGVVVLAAAGAVGHFAFDGSSHAINGGSSAKSNPLSINMKCAKSAENQVAIDRCAGKIESEAQQVLNAALAKERVAISPALVNAAEEKWVIYRDAECTEFAAINKGGTIYPTEFSSCEYGLTVKRIADVRAATHWASL